MFFKKTKEGALEKFNKTFETVEKQFLNGEKVASKEFESLVRQLESFDQKDRQSEYILAVANNLVTTINHMNSIVVPSKNYNPIGDYKESKREMADKFNLDVQTRHRAGSS